MIATSSLIQSFGTKTCAPVPVLVTSFVIASFPWKVNSAITTCRLNIHVNVLVAFATEDSQSRPFFVAVTEPSDFSFLSPATAVPLKSADAPSAAPAMWRYVRRLASVRSWFGCETIPIGAGVPLFVNCYLREGILLL